MPDLVDDLARLGVDLGVVLGRLQLRQRLERGVRQLRAEEQRLQAGDDRVAAEHGHEPRHPGRGQAAPARPAAHPQRRQIGDRVLERALEDVPAGAELRDAQAPGRHRVHHVFALVAEAALDHLRHHHLAVERRDEVHAQVPALPRLELDPVLDDRALEVAERREDDLRPGQAGVAVVFEQELALVGVVPRSPDRRQRLRPQRIAEREVVLLDREDVGEVAAELEREVERDRVERLVLDREVVLHALADEAEAGDRELILLEAARERVAHVEGGGEVLDLVRGQHQRPLSVQGQAQAGEEARVLGEQAGDGGVDVAPLVADAEDRAF